ncbi:hypothetical protein EV360DRAFT_71780 [Lentinula raphanica]|nr:hypothetical protein EV360DRAFT_71780 [Lentinula raphanica]
MARTFSVVTVLLLLASARGITAVPLLPSDQYLERRVEKSDSQTAPDLSMVPIDFYVRRTLLNVGKSSRRVKDRILDPQEYPLMIMKDQSSDAQAESLVLKPEFLPVSPSSSERTKWTVTPGLTQIEAISDYGGTFLLGTVTFLRKETKESLFGRIHLYDFGKRAQIHEPLVSSEQSDEEMSVRELVMAEGAFQILARVRKWQEEGKIKFKEAADHGVAKGTLYCSALTEPIEYRAKYKDQPGHDGWMTDELVLGRDSDLEESESESESESDPGPPNKKQKAGR